MGDYLVIERLEHMLHLALDIISKQSALLAQHGIETDDGCLESDTSRLIDDARKTCEIHIRSTSDDV